MMHFVRSRMGLIAWLAVILVVLLVPHWRLRATRQWKSPTLNFDFNSRSYGLSPELEQEARRRFPDDPMAQVAALRGVDLGGISLGRTANPYADPRVRRAEDDYFARYDALERRFPGANFIRSQRLRDTMRSSLAIDEGPQPTPEGVPSPHASPTPKPVPWLSAQQLQAGIGSAHEGGRREPNNAFFPCMEAVLNFSLKRDQAAISSLERAGRCAHFDDGVSDTTKSRLELLRRLRATGWEDDVSEAWGALLPHLSLIRSAARATMGRARQARDRGDEVRALALAGTVQRAGAALTRTHDILITKMVGEGICLIAWDGITERQPDRPKPPTSTGFGAGTNYRAAFTGYQRQIAGRFALYARSHGRSDLAREAQTFVSHFDSQQLSAVYNSPRFDTQLSRAHKLTQAYWLGAVLIIFGLLASVAWFVAWLISGRTRDDTIRRQTLLWAMFCVGGTAAVLVMIALWLPDAFSIFEEQADGAPKTPYIVTVLGDNTGLFLGLLWAVPVVGATLIRRASAWNFRHENGGQVDFKRIVAALLCAGFVLGMGGVLLAINRTLDSFFGMLFPFCAAILLGCTFVGSILLLLWSSGRRRLSRLCFIGALWLMLATPLVWSGFDGGFYGPIFTFVFVGLLLGCVFFGRGELGPGSLNAVGFVGELASRARVAAATLALFCALSYAGIALWTIPVEQAERELLNHQLQVGEVTVLREQLQKPG